MSKRSADGDVTCGGQAWSCCDVVSEHSVDENAMATEGMVGHQEMLWNGEGIDKPNLGSVCYVVVTANNGRSENRKLVVGDADTPLDRAIELAVMKLCSGSKFKLEDKGSPGHGLTLKLKNFNRAKDIYDWSNEELFESAKHHKARGIELFTQNKHNDAFIRFSRASKLLILCSESDSARGYTTLLHVCFNNLAACQLVAHNYTATQDLATRVLHHDPDNPKALFRRGSALLHLQDFDQAKVDLERADHLCSNNKEITAKLFDLKKRMKGYDANCAAYMKSFLNFL